jgi:predicted RNA binding protein YcfA (HicA-like mRNA interferase family)
MPISGKALVRRLIHLGWRIKSQRGSHVKLVKGEKVTQVPVHGNLDLGIGLIKAIERQTGEKLL